ncbi:MAG: hypothetical protein J3Q66DRAFT_335267 [Benniella sp.]|nr:MAG: hypothetical protein J3Q66DRAFT_335267 [Benniella sp.]
MSSVGCSSGGGSGSGSGSCSKPALNRSVTGPSGLQQSTASTLPTSGLQECVLNEQDLISYEALPADFDYGDVPFYDTDPRTGIIYGDPRSIILPYLVPEKYFDLYRVVHDLEDPRKANVYNKYGVLLYYHPGRHIGQEQDSLRSSANNQPIWTISGRTSTWGVLTAMELSTKRNIRIMMENNKKKAATESGEPLARFVFRWKDDDFVVEYRKQKDQYRITTSQMCGGESKWRPPQPKPSQTMFHGIGMDAPGNPLGASTIGTPSPYDPSRYLQLISEYRLNSGPVRKEGDFELYNPDTFPPEFRTFLLLISIVVLDSMRPVDDKTFYKEFPVAALLKSKTATKSGFHTLGGPLSGVASQVVVPSKEGSNSSTSLNADESSSSSSTSVKATTLSNVDVEPEATPAKAALRSRSKTLATSAPASAAAPTKKSRWASFFKK